MGSMTRFDRFDKKSLTIAAAFAAIYIIWGTTYLGIRIAIETIPPFLMAGTRFVIAGTATLLFLRVRGTQWPSRIHWRSAAIIGAFLIVGGNGLVTWSEQQVPSGIAALVVATMPIWMALFGWLIFKSSKPNREVVIGLFLGFIGIGLLVGPAQIMGTTTFDLASLLVLFLAPILWSLGSLYSRGANLPENVFMSTGMEMLIGGLLLLLASLFTGEFSEVNIQGISSRSLIATVYLTIFGSIVALTAYVWLLKTVQPARAATYTYVNPIIAVFLGWLVFAEPVTGLTLVAVVVIISAVVLITTRGGDRRKNQSQLKPIQAIEVIEAPAASD